MGLLRIVHSRQPFFSFQDSSCFAKNSAATFAMT